MHHGDELGRGAQRPNDPVQPRVDGDVQGGRHRRQQHKGRQNVLFQADLVLLAVADRKHRAAAHRKAQQDRGQKRHQRKRRPHGSQRARAQKPPHDQRVRNVIALLQKVAQDHRHRKAQHRRHHRPPGQLMAHILHPSNTGPLPRIQSENSLFYTILSPEIWARPIIGPPPGSVNPGGRGCLGRIFEVGFLHCHSGGARGTMLGITGARQRPRPAHREEVP